MKKVIVKAAPGFANCFLVYASGYSLAKRNNAELIMDVSLCQSSPRGYKLDELAIPDNQKISHWVYDSQIDRFNSIPNINNINVGRIVFAFLQLNNEISGSGVDNYAIVSNIEEASLLFNDYDTIYLCDFYMEPYIYFQDYWQEVVSFFNMREKSVEIDYFKSLIGNKTSIAVHFRRGDMLFADFAIDMLDEYYLTAIEICRRKYINPIFCIFSDDIAYAKSVLGTNQDLYYIHFLGYDKVDLLDIICMSLCNHRIVSNNSSYSNLAHLMCNNTNRTRYMQGEIVVPSKNSIVEKIVKKTVQLITRSDDHTYIVDYYDVKKYKKNYKLKFKDNNEEWYLNTLKEVVSIRISEDNAKRILDKIMLISINDYYRDKSHELLLLKAKMTAHYYLKQREDALQICDMIYTKFADDLFFRDIYGELLEKFGYKEESNLWKLYKKHNMKIIMAPGCKTLYSRKKYGFLSIACSLYKMGYEVYLLIDPKDKTEMHYSSSGKLIDYHDIELGPKVIIKKQDSIISLISNDNSRFIIINRDKEVALELQKIASKENPNNYLVVYLDCNDKNDPERFYVEETIKNNAILFESNSDVMLTPKSNEKYNTVLPTFYWDDTGINNDWFIEKKWNLSMNHRTDERSIRIANAINNICEEEYIGSVSRFSTK